MARTEVDLKSLSRSIAMSFMSKFYKYNQIPLSTICTLQAGCINGSKKYYISKARCKEYNYRITEYQSKNVTYTISVTDKYSNFIINYLALVSLLYDDDFAIVFETVTVPELSEHQLDIYATDIEISMEKIGGLTHMYNIFGKSDNNSLDDDSVDDSLDDSLDDDSLDDDSLDDNSVYNSLEV